MQVPSVTQLNIPLQVQGVTSGTSITTATNIPPALAVLPAATILKGNVAGRDQQGNTLLRTEKGTLVLATDFTLKRGVELSIKLDKVQDKLFARIITIDGKSVAKYVESQQGGAVPEDDVIIAPRPLTGSVGSSAQAQLVKDAAIPFPQLKAILLSAVPAKADGIPQTPLPLPPLPPSVGAMMQQAKPGMLFTVEIRQVQFPDASLTPMNLPAAASIVAQNVAASSAASILTHSSQTALPELSSPPPSTGMATNAAATSSTLIPGQSATGGTPLPSAATPAASGAATIAIPPSPGSASQSTTLTPMPAPAQSANVPSASSSLSPQPAAIRTESNAPLPQAYGAYTPATRPSITPPTQPVQYTGSQALIQGIVVGESEGEDVILQSPLGLMRVMVPQLLPAGTKVFFQIMHAEMPDTEQNVSAPLTAGQTTSSRPESLHVLQSLTYPATGIGASPNPVHLIPRPGNEMTTELFFLLSAIKGGDLRKWLENQPRRELEKLGEVNITRLQQEFSGLRHVVTDTRDQSQWNLYHLPIVTGQELHEAKFYYRDPRGQNPQSDGVKREESEHFVFDITFSRIGHMQLDGLIRRPDKNRLAFDLTIRSDRPLPQEMTRQIHAIFTATQEVAGFSGVISFRAGIGACLPLDAPQPSPAGNTSSILA